MAGEARARMGAICFALGSLCFLVGPFPGYAQLVGDLAAAITFFVGSVLFTAGGIVQVLQAAPERRGAGRGAWWAATIQSAGTVAFNVSTFAALVTALASPAYDRLVWRPDAIGSVCFLASGGIAYIASPRHGWAPLRGSRGWWQPAVNLLGCVLFGVAAVAGYVVPATGSVLDLAAANWSTSAGAACFLAYALGALRSTAPRRPGPSRPGDAARRAQRSAGAGRVS